MCKLRHLLQRGKQTLMLENIGSLIAVMLSNIHLCGFCGATMLLFVKIPFAPRMLLFARWYLVPLIPFQRYHVLTFQAPNCHSTDESATSPRRVSGLMIPFSPAGWEHRNAYAPPSCVPRTNVVLLVGKSCQR
jgi:hypothetical protein